MHNGVVLGYHYCERWDWHVDQEGARRIDDDHSMMHSEAVSYHERQRHGYRHVDQEGARRIDDGPSVMQDEEVFAHSSHEHGDRHVDQEEIESL